MKQFTASSEMGLDDGTGDSTDRRHLAGSWYLAGQRGYGLPAAGPSGVPAAWLHSLPRVWPKHIWARRGPCSISQGSLRGPGLGLSTGAPLTGGCRWPGRWCWNRGPGSEVVSWPCCSLASGWGGRQEAALGTPASRTSFTEGTLRQGKDLVLCLTSQHREAAPMGDMAAANSCPQARRHAQPGSQGIAGPGAGPWELRVWVHT